MSSAAQILREYDAYVKRVLYGRKCLVKALALAQGGAALLRTPVDTQVDAEELDRERQEATAAAANERYKNARKRADEVCQQVMKRHRIELARARDQKLSPRHQPPTVYESEEDYDM
jgi:tRNA(Glu) U13 pseudouridine synthase TruD